MKGEERAGLRILLGSLAVRVERVPGLPLVALRAWILGGSRLEPSPGLSLVTGRALSEGTRRRDWSRWATEVEDRGMNLQTTGSVETLGIGLDALGEDAAVAVDWLGELLLEPSFPEERLRWLRRQAAAELEGMLDRPDYRTGRVFLEQLYHPHPYSRPPQGDRESLERITPDDCREFYGRALGWGGCLTVLGDIDETAVVERLRERLGPTLVAGDGNVPSPPEILGTAERRREVTVGGRDQAHLFLGHVTVPRAHPDRPALDVASVILGSGPGMAGRIPHRVREREGLAYAVDVSLAGSAGLDPGRLTVYLGTAPANLEQGERAIREELQRALDDGFTEEEFAEARSYLAGREPFFRETLRQRAERMAEAEVYGLPADRPGWFEAQLRALDRGTVEAAVRRWVRPEELRVTVGLPRG